jgi:hypothetical protein
MFVVATQLMTNAANVVVMALVMVNVIVMVTY